LAFVSASLKPKKQKICLHRYYTGALQPTRERSEDGGRVGCKIGRRRPSQNAYRTVNEASQTNDGESQRNGVNVSGRQSSNTKLTRQDK